MAKIIRVDGTEATLSDTSLKSLQGAVGGYIEIVNAQNGKLIVVDEEGKLKGKPVNVVATKLYGNPYDVIVGDVVVCDSNEID
jgi:hypothetical protein